jgi:WD40 repeat protein/serine/threonine protein kinase
MNSEPVDVKSIFAEALDRTDSQERAEYLDGVCGSDKALREEVESLLTSYERVDGFLPSPDLDAGVTMDSPCTLEGPGAVIGRYKLLEKIGEGGMAVVYMAEQREPVCRKVALKVIKIGMDTRQVIGRFEAERQALALMDHPSIAKVFDGGATQTGRPYFVMELVKGVSITECCDRNNLGTKERLRLFIQICHAVQHAHQKGIIHRDIKPSNVMVTLCDDKAVPKVIDFGIAKATTNRLTERTLFTRYAQMIGTPEYMSPEQAQMSAIDVDTRTDIYSLGVLLYELLTGTTPFDAQKLRQAGYAEVQRIIRDTDPVTPSTKLQSLGGAVIDIARNRQTNPESLRKQLRGDLDWIVMKALEKDRRRRYETASGLAIDIERYLSDEPVAARPPSTSYRLRKFVRRNKVKVIAGGMVVTSLLLGICVSTWQAVRATDAENMAEKSRAEEAAQRLIAERQNYSASIALAENLIEQGQYGGAKQVLAKPGFSSLRGWEWGWLQRACHRDLMTLHSGGPALTGVKFTSDGHLLATGCLDGTARLWEASTGRQIRKLSVGRSFVLLLDFSPNDRRLVTPNLDGTAKVWDVASGQELFTLTGHGDWVYCAAFSPDGNTIATASRDKTVRLWDARDGTQLKIAGRYDDSVMCVAFSPDGRKLAYAGGSGDRFINSSDTAVRILDLETGQSRALAGHSSTIACVVFSPGGEHVATASWDGTARLGNVRSGTQMDPFFTGPHYSAFWSVAFSPDGRLCAVGGLKGMNAGAYVIELESHRELQAYEGHSEMVRGVAFSPDGARIVTTSFDGTAKVWPVSLPSEYLSLEGHDRAVWTIALSPNGQWLATGSLDQTAKIWDIESGQLLLTLPVGFPVVSLAFSPDDRHLATVAADATAKVWDLALQSRRTSGSVGTSEAVLTLAGHSSTVTCLAYGPRGGLLATGSKDNTARIWEAQSGRFVRSLQGHSGWITAIAFSPDGNRLATASADHTVRVWEVETGRHLFSLEGHAYQVVQSDWNWDKSGSWPSTARPNTDWFLQVAWSPDGKLIATGGQDGTLRMWNAATGTALLPPLQGHRDGVSSIAFSPDGQRLATAGGGIQTHQTFARDPSINLWDVATGQNLLRLKAHDNVVRAVAFGPNGRRLITASVDHTARVRNAFSWRIEDYPGDPTSSPEERMERYKAQYWSQILAGAGAVSGVRRRVEERTGGEYNVAVSGLAKTRPSRPIPAREPNTGPSQIDLSDVYNAALNEAWQPTDGLESLGQDLLAFPAGSNRWKGVLFDARGVIQLCSSHPDWSQFPNSVAIPTGCRFKLLHVLHGVAHVERDGVAVGAYKMVYADGREHEIEIQYGRDLRDWWVSRDPEPTIESGDVAWSAPRLSASSAEETVRLFGIAYVNPHPEVDVIRIDFVSEETQSAPFLLAMTVE